MSTIANRLNELRLAMTQVNADFYFVPAADPHNNEYVPQHWQRRQFISNFSGSAGDAMITLDNAYLWTDPRYHLQAEAELDSNCYHLIKATQLNDPLFDWLAQQNAGFRLALDPKVISIHQAKRLQQVVEQKQGTLLWLEHNLVDAIWQDQPPLPSSKITLFPEKYSGQSTTDKLHRLQKQLQNANINAMIVNNLADLAWLLNIRGNDIAYNPMVIATLIVSKAHCVLFVEPDKITVEAKDYFEKHHIKTAAPNALKTQLQALTGTVWLDPNHCNHWIEQQLEKASILATTTPIALWKAIKNPTEILGMQQAHVQDALAVVKFLHWLEKHWRDGISELSAANQLDALRRENPLCIDLSFNTISGFGANGAVIHYRVDDASSLTINDSSLYLVDSGGQYVMGTTDITRTIHLGEPTSEQRKHYTLVLKGHLALGNTRFPAGTRGEHLNAFARAPLWQHGLDYGHGTGHGVGCYSCVHESPPRISPGPTQEPLQANMVLSNEPGVYFKNEYGIRIENLCYIKEAIKATDSKTQHGPFLQLENLTLVPYCLRLIDTTLLTADEIHQINAYHDRVFLTLKPLLQETQLLAWLAQATQALPIK